MIINKEIKKYLIKGFHLICVVEVLTSHLFFNCRVFFKSFSFFTGLFTHVFYCIIIIYLFKKKVKCLRLNIITQRNIVSSLFHVTVFPFFKKEKEKKE